MILAYKPDTERYTPERCHIIGLSNREEDENCSIARARVEPGVTTQLHALRGTAERYVILEGEGSVDVEGEALAVVRPLDIVYIPSGACQRITNTGNTDLIFLCVCTPRFRPESYEQRGA